MFRRVMNHGTPAGAIDALDARRAAVLLGVRALLDVFFPVVWRWSRCSCSIRGGRCLDADAMLSLIPRPRNARQAHEEELRELTVQLERYRQERDATSKRRSATSGYSGRSDETRSEWQRYCAGWCYAIRRRTGLVPRQPSSSPNPEG